jgi:hypothetical protein
MERVSFGLLTFLPWEQRSCNSIDIRHHSPSSYLCPLFRLNPKKSLSDISEWCREIFQMSKAPAKATLSSIVRNGDTWLREGMEATNPQKFLKRKRRANSGIDALEERLALWARRAELEKFRPPTDRELLTQAQALAAEDGLDKFVDSQEWLLRFKRRYETDRAQLHQAYVTGASGMAAGSGLAPIPPGMLLLTPRLAPTGAHSRGIEIIGPYPELGLLPGGMSSTPRGLALGAQTPPQARLEPRLSGQAQVAMWLREFGLGDEVLRRFEAEDMDADALTEATEEELESMGVRKMGHRKKLLKWARAWAATM